jgi:hypothetical protein
MACGACAKRDAEFEKKIEDQRVAARAKEQEQQAIAKAKFEAQNVKKDSQLHSEIKTQVPLHNNQQPVLKKTISLSFGNPIANEPIHNSPEPKYPKIVHLSIDPNNPNDPLRYKLSQVYDKRQQRLIETIAHQKQLRDNTKI